MYCVILVVFSHLALVSLIDLKHSDNVSNTQCSAQLKFLSRHSLQKWRFLFFKKRKNKSIHQNYYYLYYNSTDHESISVVFH